MSKHFQGRSGRTHISEGGIISRISESTRTKKSPEEISQRSGGEDCKVIVVFQLAGKNKNTRHEMTEALKLPKRKDSAHTL